MVHFLNNSRTVMGESSELKAVKKNKLELEHARLIDAVPLRCFLLPSSFRRLPGLLSHHTYSTFPGHVCPLDHYRACRQVQ